MSLGRGATQPALPLSRKCGEKIIRHLPVPAQKEKAAGEHRGGMGSPGGSGVGVWAAGAHKGPEELRGMKQK